MASKRTPRKIKKLAANPRYNVTFDGKTYRVDGQKLDRWQQVQKKAA